MNLTHLYGCGHWCLWGLWLWVECGAVPSGLCPAQSHGLGAELEEERGKPAMFHSYSLHFMLHSVRGSRQCWFFPPSCATDHFSVLTVPECKWCCQLGEYSTWGETEIAVGWQCAQKKPCGTDLICMCTYKWTPRHAHGVWRSLSEAEVLHDQASSRTRTDKFLLLLLM